MSCSVDGCTRHVEKQGLCAAHRKRKQRGQEVSAPVRDYRMKAEERLSKAALRYANAESDDEYRRAKVLLAKYSQGHAGRQRVSVAIRIAVEAVLRELGIVVRRDVSVGQAKEPKEEG